LFVSVEEMIIIRHSEHEQFISQQEELRDLRKLVRQLREEIELLKNGGNSKTGSTAPSQDISRSNVRSLCKISGKQPGGQKGHQGHTLSMSEMPDRVIDHLPERCTCGCSLENVLSSGQTRRQVVDIPPVKPEYTEHRSHYKVCPGCGRVNAGIYLPGVNTHIQYGSNVKSIVSYMSVYHYLPYKRLFGMSKSKQKCPVSFVTGRERALNGLPEYVLLLIPLSRTDRMSS
jgi:transposase